VDALERIYRAEAPRITAALAARTGDVGLAADAVQDAFVEAIEHWRDGPPPNPGGWLATTARRKAIDRLRRAKAGQEKLTLLAATETGLGADTSDAEEADDELLGMIFACCHPVLPRESQIALTLRAACGLTTAEIAAAFLAAEPAMTQRLLRARKALRAAHADLRVPDPDALADRLAEVLAVVYLVFNEGYLASAGRQPARRDLAAQAVALARLLHRLMPREPEVLGLLALMLLHESRAATRFDGWGRLVRPGPVALEPRAHRRGHRAARPRADPARIRSLSGPGGHRGPARGGPRLRPHRLAPDPAALRPAPGADPVPGGPAQPGRGDAVHRRSRGRAGRDRAAGRRTARVPAVPRAAGRPADRPRP
jgi:RNA polymerase sigma-70 factor (ECF subfamily)